jgi:hypothetical protein
MSGLVLGMMGGASTSPGNTDQNGFTSSIAPKTATEAGFGQGWTQAGDPSTANALFPNDPFGIAFWVGVACLGGLIFIRHSLPA